MTRLVVHKYRGNGIAYPSPIKGYSCFQKFGLRDRTPEIVHNSELINLSALQAIRDADPTFDQQEEYDEHE